MLNNGQFFLTEDSEVYRLFLKLPIYPEPPITVKELAEILKIEPHACFSIISRLPTNAPIYHDFGEIGRLR